MKNAKVVLKKGKEVIFQNRHLWIFSGAIASFSDGFEDGSVAAVYSHSNELLGHGYFKQNNNLSGRIISFGTALPLDTLLSHIDQAISLRESLIDTTKTNAYRLIHAEGDHIPGLVVDQYADYLVLQSSTLGIDLLKEKIINHLVQKGRWKGIFEKSTSTSRKQDGLKPEVNVLFGEDVKEIEILENNHRFLVNWRDGQKTGFFLDQRFARNLIGSISKGKRVLNCFSYTGGFSVYAAANGAKSVDSLDISLQALETAEKNFTLNHLNQENAHFIEGDAFEFLRNEPLDYDLIILDPPAFVKKKGDIPKGIKGYREINAQVIQKAPKNTFLLTCSCSQYVDEGLFRTMLFQAGQSAKRNIQIIQEISNPIDHPISLFHPEGRYLKSLLLHIS